MRLAVSCLALTLYAQNGGVVSVKSFGARGDGLTDDYDALQAAATYICGHPGKTLLFPAGTYRIGRYRITGGRDANTVRNIRYTECKNVTIRGVGAKIDVKGDFRRSADSAAGAAPQSYRNGVIPFEMVNSSDFVIEGFELNGNVDRMSRDSGVGEGSNAGILTTNCSRYTIQDVYVHHFPTDGITLGGNSEIADRDAVVRRVIAAHNARQGLSIIQVRGATVSGSTFKLTGRTDGAYGNHAPSAGVDVEPVRAPPEEDLKTGAILFDDCRFEDNLGIQFVSGWPDKVDRVTVQNSRVAASRPDGEICAFLNVAGHAVNRGNIFDLAAPHAVYLGLITPPLYRYIERLEYWNNHFTLGFNGGIRSAVEQAPVDFIGNTVEVRPAGRDTSTMQLDYLNRVEGNRFFIAASGWSGRHDTISYEKGTASVRDNTYVTDLAGSRQFEVRYGPGILCGPEHFPAAAFKPIAGCHTEINRLPPRVPASSAR